jgi:Mn-dependent DtxR family transcriptional regulator
MNIAEEDACIIEHYLHKVTMSRLRHFMKYIVEETDFSSDRFDRYYEEGNAEPG